MGGNQAELIEFGKACYEQERFDTIVPFQLLTALTTLVDRQNNELWSEPGVSEMVNDCLERTYQSQKKSADPIQQRWLIELRSYQAILASFVNRFEIAEPIYRELGTELFDDANRKLGIAFGGYYWKSETRFEMQPYSTELKQVQRWWTKKSSDRSSERETITSMIEEGLSNCQDDEALRVWKAYKKINQQEIEYREGKWIELEFENGLFEWETTNAELLSVLQDGTLRVSNENHDGFSMIGYRAQFEGAKIIEYELELVKPIDNSLSGEPENNFQFACATGFFDSAFRRPEIHASLNYGLYCRNSRVQSTTTGYWSYGKFLNVNVPWMKEKSHHRLHLGQEYLESYVDGEVDQFRLMYKQDGMNEIGFCILHKSSGKGEFLVRNVRVKRWAYGDLLRNANPADWYGYWKNRANDANDNRFAWEMAAWYAHQIGKEKECIDACERILEIDSTYHIVDFYSGAIADSNGDARSALKHYERAANAKCQRTFIGNTEDLHSDYKKIQDLASIRYLWMLGTNNKLHDAQAFAKAYKTLKVGYENPWEQLRIDALANAINQDFENAAMQCEQALQSAPAQFREGINAQLKAYKDKRQYQPENDDLRYFLRIQHVMPSMETNR